VLAALGFSACGVDTEEPLGTTEDALTPVCVTIRRGESGDVRDLFLSGDSATYKTGTEQNIYMGVSSGGNLNTPLYGFDLSPVPSDATVTSAAFKTYISWNADNNLVFAHRVLAPWSEADTSASTFDLADIDPIAEGSFLAGGVGFKSVNLTSLVDGWVNGTIPNHGIALQESPVSSHHSFSSEVSAGLRPYLDVCYTAGTCTDGVLNQGELGVDCGGPCDECFCSPSEVVACYSGPAGTQGVGPCAPGEATCNAQGSAFGPCSGEVTPVAESCGTAQDDDCDGEANEGCICAPGASSACYSGPTGTQGVGQCSVGVQTCTTDGTAYGPCIGEVTPGVESCATAGDDDCDGQTNEGCVCVPGTSASCYSGPGGTQNVGICKAGSKTCNAQGTAYGACTGEVLPVVEACNNGKDDDCDGTVNENCAAASCALYSENWDDGNAGELTSGEYKIGWCDTNIPTSQNTPLCMSGRTLRTNVSTEDPTLWVSRGAATCTSVKITYGYYQFAASGVALQYQRSNDATEVCEKTGTFTALATYPTLQACVAQSQTVTFNTSSSIYLRFEHGIGTNAIWFDDVTIELLGCSC